MEKLVSIIMPAYNCMEYIAQSIRSVQNQTYRNWELIVADDNSTDGTVDTVRSIAADDNRIQLLETDINLGPAAARNRAINAARGDYIAFLDSDDIWFPDKLRRQISFMEQTGYDFTYTAYEKINERSEKMGIVVSAPKSVNYSSMLYRGDPIGNLTVVYDATKLGKFYVPDIKKRNDFALWLKIMHACECAYGLNEVLASYRVRSGSISSMRKSKLLKYYWKLYHDIEKLSNVKASAAMVTLIFFKSIRQTDQRMQRVRNNFKIRRNGEKKMGDFEEQVKNAMDIATAMKLAKDKVEITIERTEESKTETVIRIDEDVDDFDIDDTEDWTLEQLRDKYGKMEDELDELENNEPDDEDEEAHESWEERCDDVRDIMDELEDKIDDMEYAEK